MAADVSVVQKQTALERYTRRPLNIDFFEYLERDGQSLDALILAHDAHAKSREELFEALVAMGLTFEVFNLDELHEAQLGFYHPDKPYQGLKPQKNLVVSLGGDGTLLHASHYTGGSTQLLGLNSCPTHSVGHLCAASSGAIRLALEETLAGCARKESLSRIRVQSTASRPMPLALNDVLVCNRHPAATSRYQITIAREGAVLATERQLSSGIWVSSAAGSTAAISSYGLPRCSLSDTALLYAVREPYEPMGKGLSHRSACFLGEGVEIEIFARMRQGLVCVDGPDSSVEIGFGDSVQLSTPPAARLSLVVGFGS